MTFLVLLAATLAFIAGRHMGARQQVTVIGDVPAATQAPAATVAEPTPPPQRIEVPIDTATVGGGETAERPPAPAETSREAPAATTEARPAETATSGAGTLSANASCSDGRLKVDFRIQTPEAATLRWFSLYVARSVVTGGPLSGREHADSYEGDAARGTHDLELVASYSNGGRDTHRFGVRCN